MALKNLKKKTTEEKGKKQAPPAEEKKGTGKATAASGDWFAKGGEGLKKKHQLDEIARMRKEKGVPRFFLKHTGNTNEETGAKDNEARIVFLDSEGFWVHEHNLKLDGRWGNMFTCVKELGPCPICEATGDKPTFTCYYTVIDTRKWPKKDGTISKSRKVLFPAKGTASDIIADLRKENDNNLRGLVVDVKRRSDKDPNCGREFKVAGRVDPSKKFTEPDMAKPYDYMKVLAPPTPKELEAAGVGAHVPVGSTADIGETDVGVEEGAALLDD